MAATRRIAGTRIKVSPVAPEYEHQRMTPDEIIEAHPHLSPAQIHAALASYYDHQDEIVVNGGRPRS